MTRFAFGGRDVARLPAREPGRAWLRAHRHELQMAALLTIMVVLPSAVLGTFAWRAIENEKLAWGERERQTYRELANLAGRGIDEELRAVERGWSTTIDSLGAAGPRGRLAQREAALPGGELIRGAYLISVSGGVLYPPALASRGGPGPRTVDPETLEREREQFEQLMSRGEELEYLAHDHARAIAAYRDALGRVSSDELRSMLESAIGRAQVKAGDLSGAIATYRDVLARYPEVRDLNRMVVRFLAQYQIAAALGDMGRAREALDSLLVLNQDLLARSGEITALQYSYYSDLIHSLAPRLLSAPGLGARERYEDAFRRLSERTKKRLSQKYMVQVLQSELEEAMVRRPHVPPRLRYVSHRADGDPFLLAYRESRDAAGVNVTGLAAVEVDLGALRRQIFPAIVGDLQVGHEIALAIVGEEGNYVFGTEPPVGEPFAQQTLAEPFDFWRVAVQPRDSGGARHRMDLRAGVWMGAVSLLLLSILFGAFALLRRAQRQAHLARARATFVSNVSHELRTPIASIQMFSELVERELAVNGTGPAASRTAALSQYVSFLRQESDRLARLIESVLDFSRMERGGRVYRFELRDLSEVLGAAVESFRPTAESQAFRLEVELSESLPPVRLDGDAICQVLLNLLSNAVRYSDAVREIRVRAYREGPWVAFDVVDRGIGIAARDLPRVFEQFFRADQRLDSARQGGLGLGLTLARGIVRAHGGEILVSSEPGHGSTFRVLLPVPEEPSGWRAPAPPERAVEAGS